MLRQLTGDVVMYPGCAADESSPERAKSTFHGVSVRQSSPVGFS